MKYKNAIIKSMTKKELIAAVSTANPGFLKKTVEEAVSLFFDLISHYLANHQRIELRGFGTFSIRQRPAHHAHNPQTGEKIYIPEKVVPFFKPSQYLKETLKTTYKQPAAAKGKFFPFVFHNFKPF